MAKRWQFSPIACVVLLMLCLTAFALDRVDSTARMSAETLGYPGEGLRITAVPDGTEASATGLTSSLLDYASANGLSIAYTRWYESGVVTLYDPLEQFRNSEGPLWPLLRPSGDDSPGVAVAASVRGSASAVTNVLGVGRAGLVSEFRADVMFEGRYPIALVTAQQDAFDLGVYFIAGTGLDSYEVARLFANHGLTVVDASSRPSVSITATLSSALASIYGAVSGLFWLTLVGATALALGMLAATRRRKYEIAKALGATPRDAIRLIGRDLLPSIGVGLLSGSAVSALVTWATMNLSTASAASRLLATLSAIAVSVLLCTTLVLLIARLEQGRRLRANLL